MKRIVWCWAVTFLLAGCGASVTDIPELPDTPSPSAEQDAGERISPDPEPQGGGDPDASVPNGGAISAAGTVITVVATGRPDAGGNGGAPLSPTVIPSATGEPKMPEGPFEPPPLQTSVEEYELVMPDPVLQNFKADPWAPEQPATFRFNGQSFPVMVELRGASARFFDKKSWNVDFESLRFDGRRRLNLVAEFQDSTMMAEKLAYDLLAAMGVPAPKAKYVRLKVNGQYEGVFLDLEQVDKHFLSAHGFSDDDGTIYRCGWKDCEMKTWKVPYQGDWSKKTNEAENDAALFQFLELVNHTPEPQFAQALETYFDVERYLRILVVDQLMSNNYQEDSESYVIHDRVENRWSYVPWDLNNVDARFWHTYPLDDRPHVNHPLWGFTPFDYTVQRRYDARASLYPGYLPVYSNLTTRVTMNPALRARLLTLLNRARTELFTEAKMHARITAMHNLIAPYMPADPYIDQAKFQNGLPYLKGYVTGRLSVIANELNRVAAPQTVVIEAFDPALGTVTVRNRGAQAVDLGTLSLTTNLREPRQKMLPAGTLASGQTQTFTAAGLGMTFQPKGELGLFGPAHLVDFRDVLFYGALPAGQRYERNTAGEWTAR